MKQRAKIWHPKPTGQCYKDVTGPSWQDELSSEQKRKIMYARRMADRKAQEQYELEHRYGYCPICHCLRAQNGKCMNGCEGY